MIGIRCCTLRLSAFNQHHVSVYPKLIFVIYSNVYYCFSGISSSLNVFLKATQVLADPASSCQIHCTLLQLEVFGNADIENTEANTPKIKTMYAFSILYPYYLNLFFSCLFVFCIHIPNS